MPFLPVPRKEKPRPEAEPSRHACAGAGPCGRLQAMDQDSAARLVIRRFAATAAAAWLAFAPHAAAAAKPAPKKPAATVVKPAAGTISSKYRFKKPRELRKSTKYIVLHTTEGSSRGSIAKLSANGECNYVVDTDGMVYTIVDRGRVAYHAGLSMWNGRTGLDSISVGIEIVGWHDKDITAAQYAALRKLLAELKAQYRIPDENVLTHSMVAYGNPNHWQKRRHRGRKRCGMLLALPAARTRLGLAKKPAYDPDIRAGRLADADPELTKILYTPMPAPKAPAAKPGAKPPADAKPATVSAPPAAASASNVIGPKRSAWDIARDQYDAPTTLYAFPDGTTRRGNQIKNWNKMPAGTIVTVGPAASENANEGLLTIGEDGSAQDLAGDAVAATTTFYFRPGQPYAAGATLPLTEIASLPPGTKVLVDYRVAGPVTAKTPVFSLCGSKWNHPDTYYWTSAGGLVPGDQVTDRTIPKGALVFFRK